MYLIIAEIEAAETRLIEAFNNGTLDPVDHYTEDCQLIRPGRQAVTGHKGIHSTLIQLISDSVI